MAREGTAGPVAQEHAGARPRETIGRSVGFGFERLWVLLLMYNISPLAPEAMAREVLYVHQYASTAAVAATLAFLALSARRKTQLYENTPLLVVSALAMAVGTMVYAAGSTAASAEVVGTVGLAVAGAFTGFGSANLFVAWVQEIVSAEDGNVIVEVALANCLAIVASAVLAYWLAPVGLPIMVLAPFASLALLLRIARPLSTTPPDLAPYVPLSRETVLMFARGFVGIFLLGALEGFFDTLTGYRAVEVESLHGSYLAIVGLACMALTALVGWRRGTDAMSLMYRLAVFILMLGVVGMLELRDYFTAAGAFVFAGYLVLSVATVVVCANVSRSFGIGLVRSISATFACMYVGELIGELAGNCLTPAQVPPLLPTITGAAVLLITAIVLFLFTETDFIRLGIGEIGSVVPGQPDDEAEAEPQMTPELARQRVCETIVEEHGLSPRESEVLALLLDGRTIKRIQEALYISQGTVSTHIRHIYQKTGCANRQKLLDLAERVSAEVTGGQENATRAKDRRGGAEAAR